MRPFFERFCPRAAAAGRPALMGIVNVTPDSFSDGGRHCSPNAAALWAARLLEDGADILDVGAESTRPGFSPVEAEEERRRLVPALRAIRAAFPDVAISVDTRKASVAADALAAGADIVNDVSSLEDPDMAAVVRRAGCGLVLMNGWREHVGARPRAAAPGSLGRWVARGLFEAREAALVAGVAVDALCLDPGFGFGLRGADNAEVLRFLPTIVREAGNLPVLVGPSRKHFLAAMYPEAHGDSDRATALFCSAAVAAGARILRVHAPAASIQALAQNAAPPRV